MKERFTIAAVQPDSVWGQDEWRNAEVAYRAVEEGAARGAELITFPEGFPGPCNGPLDSGGQLDTPPIERLRELAKQHGVYIVGSDLEPSPELPDGYYLTLKLIDRSGEPVANYRRAQPDMPGSTGIGIIAGPDGPVATLDGAGILYGQLDMARLAWLRTHYYEPVLFEPPEDEDEAEFSCRPGQIHERRPKLYGRLVAPQPSAFDYFYWHRDREAWRAEFDKAHRFEGERYGPYTDRQVWVRR